MKWFDFAPNGHSAVSLFCSGCGIVTVLVSRYKFLKLDDLLLQNLGTEFGLLYT